MRIGVKVPTRGDQAGRPGIAEMAQAYDSAGFDSLWVTDHIVLPRSTRSRYPSAADGKTGWDVTAPWHESIVAMTLIAASASRCEVGVAVMAAALRQPVLLAKQVASIGALTGARVTLGVGAGWLAEEYDALGVSFADRGALLDDTIEILRRCWTGSPEAFEGRRLRLPAGLACYPTPPRPPDILAGGMSPPALRRAGRLADGWIGTYPAATLEPAAVARAVERVDAARPADDAGGRRRIVVRVTGSAERLVPQLAPLSRAGVTDVIIDADPRDQEKLAGAVATLRAAA